MLMWYIILSTLFIATCSGLFYLGNRLTKFGFMVKLSQGSAKRLKVLGFGCVAAVFALLVWTLNLMNAAICLLHFVVFWLIGDFAFALAARFRHKPFKRYYAGGVAVAACIIYLSAGWYLAHHVWVTRYEIATDKAVADLRIVMFADSHVGATFDAEGFARHLDTIQNLNPDVLIIAGDYVDDDTTRAEMEKATEALGRVKTAYGVYFAPGNHDKGYYGEEWRGYSEAELFNEMEKYGINILKDQTAELGAGYYIVGRLDASENIRGKGRAEIETLLQPLNKEKFSIVVDHQPNDYAKEAAAGADLVLSGHTHGGQLFPLNRAGEWIGANDRTYGFEKRGNTGFIVTSGISDWMVKFKTGTKSEIVIIDIKTAKTY